MPDKEPPKDRRQVDREAELARQERERKDIAAANAKAAKDPNLIEEDGALSVRNP